MREKYLEYLRGQKLEDLVQEFEDGSITFEEMEKKAMFEFKEISLRVFTKKLKIEKITE